MNVSLIESLVPKHHTLDREWQPLSIHSQAKIYDANPRYQQLSEIIRNLRDELHLINPKPAQLNNAMIDHLVFNCPLYLIQGNDWSLIVLDVIDYFIEHLDPLLFIPQFFIRMDRQAPLFPNNEGFDEFDTYSFFQQLQHVSYNELS